MFVLDCSFFRRSVCFFSSSSFSDFKIRYSKNRTISNPGTAPKIADNIAIKKLIFRKERNVLTAPITAIAQATPSKKLTSWESVVVFNLIITI